MEIQPLIAPINIPYGTMLLFIQSAFANFDNPLSNRYGILSIIPATNGKVKLAAFPKNIAVSQPPTGCIWQPIKGKRPTIREISPCLREMMAEWCPADFENLCEDRRLVGIGSTRYTNLPPETSLLVKTYMASLETSMMDDIAMTTWFGYEGGAPNAAPFNTNYSQSTLTAEEKIRLPLLLAECDGIFAELVKEYASGTIPLVDSNNGTANGNAINPANILGFLKQLKNKAKPVLKRHPMAMYLLQPDLWDAYYAYLTINQTNVDARRDLQDLRTDVDNGILYFEGKRVIRMDDWDLFDQYTGAFQTDTIATQSVTHSTNQRAIFTVPNNLTLAIDATGVRGTEYALIAEQNPLVSAKGRVEMYGAYKTGTGLEQIDLIVVGWNSSNTFV